MHRFLWKFLAKLTNVFSTQQAVRCFPRIRLWVASSKVPRKKSATRSRKTSWLEPKSRIARRLTGLWVGNVYAPMRDIDADTAACQLYSQKASNLHKTTFRERKTRENRSKSNKKTKKRGFLTIWVFLGKSICVFQNTLRISWKHRNCSRKYHAVWHRLHGTSDFRTNARMV